MINNKSIFLLIITALYFTFACDNSQNSNNETPEFNQAKSIAVEWIQEHYPERKNFNTLRFDTTSKDNEILSYNIDFKQGGFAIVSANFNQKRIIAYSNTGSLTNGYDAIGGIIDNFVTTAMEGDGSNIGTTGPIYFNLLNDIEIRRNVTSDPEIIEPFIKTKWSQSGGYHPNFTYNNATPYVTEKERAPAGCTSTALGQVLKYYNYPKRGLSYHEYCSTGKSVYNCWEGEIIKANFNTEYQWEQMSNVLNYNSSQENIDAISQLLFHIGVSLNTKYGEHGSNVQIENPNIFNTFKMHFRMTDIEKISRAEKTAEEWREIILNEIKAKRPVIFSGYDSKVGAGHAYILDGYNPELKGYIHVNWGWGGAANGYFDLENLIIDGKYSFTEDLIAFINITPNTVKENGSCNGPEGARCKNGLLCVNNNEVLIESESDEYGVCMTEETLNSIEDEEPAVELKNTEKSLKDSVAKNEWKHYGPFHSLKDFSAQMSGSGDADLYVKKDEEPSKDNFDCRPYKSTSLESCKLEGEGNFYVSINGYAEISDIEILVSYKIKDEEATGVETDQ